MKLRVDGIGKIRDTEIELNGITVIAGPNNTGKSTLGKSLFALVNAQTDFSNNVFADIVDKIEDALLTYLDSLGRFSVAYDPDIRSLPRSLTKTFISASNVDSAAISRWFKKQASSVTQDDSVDAERDKAGRRLGRRKLSQEKLSEVYQEMAGRKAAAISFRRKCAAVFGIKASYFRSQFAQREFSRVFQTQPFSLLKGSTTKASVSLVDDSSAAVLMSRTSFADGRCTLATENLGEQYNVLMLDSPNDITYLLDDGTGPDSHEWRYPPRRQWWWNDSRRSLVENQTRQIIFSGMTPSLSIPNDDGKSTLDDSITTVLDLLNGAHSGFVGKDDNDALVLNEPDVDVVKPVMLANASMGVKSIELLKELLRRGAIGENTFLVLDEPEIHLHPEWQIVYARAIAMISKSLGAKVLVTTHSPYFLQALVIYSQFYECENSHIYTPESINEQESAFRFVEADSERQNEIIESMAKPFDELQNIQVEMSQHKRNVEGD